MRILPALITIMGLVPQASLAGSIVHAQFEAVAADNSAIVLIGDYYEARVQCEISQVILKNRYDQKVVGTFLFDSRPECEGFIQYAISGGAAAFKTGLHLELYFQDARVVGVTRASFPRYK